MSDIIRSENYPYSTDPPMSPYPRRGNEPFDGKRAIKFALHNVSGFILLCAVLLAAFLIAMASASRVVV
jgi:hypothetical protein